MASAWISRRNRALRPLLHPSLRRLSWHCNKATINLLTIHSFIHAFVCLSSTLPHDRRGELPPALQGSEKQSWWFILYFLNTDHHWNTILAFLWFTFTHFENDTSVKELATMDKKGHFWACTSVDMAKSWILIFYQILFRLNKCF